MDCRSEDVSFVVQGPVARSEAVTTQGVCASIRRHFPGAEIILSTWEGENVEGVDADKVVFSADPGALPSPWNVNLNRQIVSSHEGIAQASRPLVMKTRTDILFQQATVLDYWKRWQHRVPDLRLFRERVLIPNTYTFQPSPTMPHVLHPSDFCFLGLKEDLAFLFDVPLCAPAEMLVPTPTEALIPWLEEGSRRYVRHASAEQYLFVSALRKRFPDIHLPSVYALTQELLTATELSLANNFVVLNASTQFGIHCPKHADAETRFGAHNLYQHTDWLDIYSHYCEREIHRTGKCAVSPVDLCEEAMEEGQLTRLYNQGYRWEAMLIKTKTRLAAWKEPRTHPDIPSWPEVMGGWCSALLRGCQLRLHEQAQEWTPAEEVQAKTGDAARIASFSAQVQSFLPQADGATSDFRLRLQAVLERLNVLAFTLLQQMETTAGYLEIERLYAEAATRCRSDYTTHLDMRHQSIMESTNSTNLFQVRAQLAALQRDEPYHGPTLHDLAAILSRQGRVAEASRVQRVADVIPSASSKNQGQRDVRKDAALAA